MRLPAILLTVLAVCACGATSSVQWDRPVVTPAVSPGPVFVMEPLVAGSASPGNIGRDFPALRHAVADRIVEILRARYPGAQIAASESQPVAPPLQGYATAAGERVTSAESNAAAWASSHGATCLLVPTITTWTEMRTDDPIGALTLPHNTVTLTLRLMRLAPAALVARVTFSNHARLTLNQPAARLLDGRFKKTVLQLVSAG